jgi:hypothetical protein
VYGEFIGERNDSQEAAVKFVDPSPEAITVLLLRLGTNRRLDNPDAHVFCQIRALTHDLLLEIWRELIVRHAVSVSKKLKRRIVSTVIRVRFARDWAEIPKGLASKQPAQDYAPGWVLKLVRSPSHSLLPSSLYLLCRASHALHSPKPSRRLTLLLRFHQKPRRRLTLPLAHRFCSLLSVCRTAA